MGVFLLEPIGKFQDFQIAPHPAREARECLALAGLGCAMAHIAINPLGVGPIGFDRDDVEPVVLNEIPRDGSAGAIEFARAVRGFTQKHQIRIAEPGKGQTERIRMFGRRQIDRCVRQCLRSPPFLSGKVRKSGYGAAHDYPTGLGLKRCSCSARSWITWASVTCSKSS